LAENVLAMSGVEKRYGQILVLRGVSLEVPEGSIVGLVGPNGAGKSTIIKIGLGILRRDKGLVSLMGRDPFRDPRARERVGVVFERPVLPGGVPVYRILEYAARIRGAGAGDVRRAVRLAGLAGHEHKPFDSLSAGLKQRAAIAHALVGDPVFIIADEPTSNLDPVERVRVLNLIAELNRDHGISFLFSSHVLPEVVRVAGEIVVVAGGVVVDRGRPEEVLGGLRRARVRASDNRVVLESLEARGLRAWEEGLSIVVEVPGPEGQRRLLEALADAAGRGATIYSLDFVEASIEGRLLEHGGQGS